MNRLQFDFLVDKNNNTLTVRREFAAERQLIWDCYTKQELLDKWFAPNPLKTRTRSMDFKNGGHWHYAMIDQDGTEYWGYTEYNNIRPIDGYETLDAFSNEAGDINQDLPRAKWRVTFTDQAENTVVETVVFYTSLNDLETVINMGMKEGMMSTLGKLDEVIINLKKQAHEKR